MVLRQEEQEAERGGGEEKETPFTSFEPCPVLYSMCSHFYDSFLIPKEAMASQAHTRRHNFALCITYLKGRSHQSYWIQRPEERNSEGTVSLGRRKHWPERSTEITQSLTRPCCSATLPLSKNKDKMGVTLHPCSSYWRPSN